LDRRPVLLTILFALILSVAASAGRAADSRALEVRKARIDDTTLAERLYRPSFAPGFGKAPGLPLTRKHPWSLPDNALAPDFDTTMRVLVLRFNFQYETDDNPNSTGRGHMDFSRPIVDSASEAAYIDSVGYLADPPPHDSAFFHEHMTALHNYWYKVSEGRISVEWDIWPRGDTATYQLPHPMDYYGACSDALPSDSYFDSVVAGLERYFVDGIQTADQQSPEIDFSQYSSIFLIHAGADAQNDVLGNTCNDLYSGFILFGDEVAVDGGGYAVRSALLLPEAVSQDGRGVALNGLIAHEFCHQLGGIDLYRTDNFFTCLGDFALMDHNGGNIALEFDGFRTGVTNAMPVFPSAWHRAYLGLVDVEEVRSSAADVRLLAAGVASSDIPKIIKVPISEYQYYLIENRVVDFDGDMRRQVLLKLRGLQKSFLQLVDAKTPDSVRAEIRREQAWG